MKLTFSTDTLFLGTDLEETWLMKQGMCALARIRPRNVRSSPFPWPKGVDPRKLTEIELRSWTVLPCRLLVQARGCSSFPVSGCWEGLAWWSDWYSSPTQGGEEVGPNVGPSSNRPEVSTEVGTLQQTLPNVHMKSHYGTCQSKSNFLFLPPLLCLFLLRLCDSGSLSPSLPSIFPAKNSLHL